MGFYWIVIRLLRLITQLYFVEIRATGRDHVPESGPVILAANHPGSILDAILLATLVRRPIHYLARSGLFRYPVIATVFRRLGAVPIYRPNETGDYAARNLAVFDRVFELLERDGCVGIFPEGRNSPPTRIGPLRKGAARMALGAEARRDDSSSKGSTGLVIVPVGINMESGDFLMSKVLLRFGEPIRVADYIETYRADPERACAALTDEILARLDRQVLQLGDARVRRLVDDLSEVFNEKLERRFDDFPGASPASTDLPWHKRWLWRVAAWYRRATPESSAAFERRMHSRQFVNDVLKRAWASDPRSVAALNNRLARYRDHLRQTELREALTHSLDQPVRQRLIRLRMSLYAVLMAPVALFGLVHNVVPYKLSQWLARLGSDEAVRTFAYFGLGVLMFALTYGLIGFGLWRETDLGALQAIVYVAALPPTGFVALRYRRDVLFYRDRILVRTVFFNHKELVQLLREERDRLHAQFERLAERFGNVDRASGS